MVYGNNLEEGAENMTKTRKQEVDRLSDDVNKGYRLACMSFASGDVTVTWDNRVEVKTSKKVKELWEEKNRG